jgi:hypothetical protein
MTVRIDERSALGRKIAARAQEVHPPKPPAARVVSGTATPGAFGEVGDQKWRCHACSEEFTAWAPAERHGNQRGHGRIELVLERG